MQKDFFLQDTKTIARSILGMLLVHESHEGKTVGKIVETEAYLCNDPASHSFSGKTMRNEAMFGKPGTAYVYFTYGMYHCFNVVTAKEGVGEAVLIRALEPLEGIELMKKRRGFEDMKQLCNGPAKLVQAMGIHKEQNGISLTQKPLFLQEGKEKIQIACSPRIGISKAQEKKLRYFIRDNPFVSR